MNITDQLFQKGLFSMEEVEKYSGNMYTARSSVQRLIKKGYVRKIRGNLYTCISLESKNPVANQFQVASAITKSSYISHHSAMEYYGFSNQVYYEMYVSANERFHDFSFNGITYHFVQSRLSDGITTTKNTKGIRISDVERTVLDSINDLDKIAGLEEIITCLSAITYLDAEKLQHYLSEYDIQFLYQKTGFLLSHFKSELKLPDYFFTFCKNSIGKSKRYLSREHPKGTLDSTWNIIVPTDLFRETQGKQELV